MALTIVPAQGFGISSLPKNLPAIQQVFMAPLTQMTARKTSATAMPMKLSL
jgi:hypothetical protein